MKPKKTSAKKKVKSSVRAKPVKATNTAKQKSETKSKAKKAATPIAKEAEAKPEKKPARRIKKASVLVAKVEPVITETKVSARKSPRSAASTKSATIEPVIPPKPVAEVIDPSATSKVSKSAAAKKKAVKRVRKPIATEPSQPARKKTAPPRVAPTESPAPRTIQVKQFPAVPARPPVRKAPANIPPILLEGDRSGPAPISGPGQRYALGPTPSVEQLEADGELPESYGTQQLLLAARDPHWLYAHWDLSSTQQRYYNSLSIDRHLVLRVYENDFAGKAIQEVHVHPESRHWFVHVTRAGTKYLAELGYYRSRGNWVTIATSGATLAPPDSVSDDTSAEFATIPFELPMAKLLSLVKEAAQESVPLAEALQEMIAENNPELPEVFNLRATGGDATQGSWSPTAEWTPAQELALAEILSMDSVRRVWMGSLEITELIRRQVMQELASMTAAGLSPVSESGPTSPMAALGAISSPTSDKKRTDKGFWFNVNAELIIYGATEADAAVTIAGRKIRLRPDGSFSYRFALPDGEYELPVVAVSSDQTDGRAVELVFSRATEIHGDVGAHPQDPELKRPEAASL